jgi:hypothetical protein
MPCPLEPKQALASGHSMLCPYDLTPSQIQKPSLLVFTPPPQAPAASLPRWHAMPLEHVREAALGVPEKQAAQNQGDN